MYKSCQKDSAKIVMEQNADGESFVFFYSKASVFSNFYLSLFRLRNRQFNCNEQFFMFSKSQRFKDSETSQAILKEMNPSKQKALGRTVKNFDQKVWGKEKYTFMIKGLKSKFLQNPELKAVLLETKDATLVECAANDVVWGIGCAISNPDRLNRKLWKGQNLLGKALMEVREWLQAPK